AFLLLALLLPQLLVPVASGSESEPEAATAPCPQTADQPPPPCDRLPFACLSCRVNATAGCRLGAAVPAVPCEPLPDVNCTGDRGPLPRTLACRYCHQLPPELYTCDKRATCKVRDPVFRHYETNCTAALNASCLGRRSFRRMLRCDWSGGYKWSVSMWCTALLGGFGLDRFYLGQWREGLGKLFSFGGFGVWSLVDAILIAVGYISPIDESVYAP
ncbi:hypothetical protein BOX15_Mlig001603g1, partial [Macrostomum lignano]